MYSMYLVPAILIHVYFRKPTWRRAFGPSDPWGLNCPTPTWVSPLENERLVHLRKSPTNRKRTSSSIFHVHGVPGCFFCPMDPKSVLFHFKFLKLPSFFGFLWNQHGRKKQPCKYMFKYNMVCMHGICSLVFLACICLKSKGAPQTHKWMKYKELSLSKSWPQNPIEWNTNNGQSL